MDVKISEKNLEDYIVKNIDKYFPKSELIDRQVNFGTIGIADIVLLEYDTWEFESSSAIEENDAEITHEMEILIIELKIDTATPSDVGQLARYVEATEEDISDTHVFSVNKKTHVFNFSVGGLLISPNIERDALALCLAMENISWQPFTISLENGFELGKSSHGHGLSGYFDYDYDGKVLKHFLEEREKCLLKAEETKNGNNK